MPTGTDRHLAPLALEAQTGALPAADRRQRMYEPLPVNLVAIDDVRLPAAAGMCEQLDWFYVSLLGFERAECAEERVIAYRAENCTLRLSLAEGVLQHPSLRPLGVQVPSLAEMINRLIDAQIDFEHVRGLAPGQESILLRDPAGNAAEVSELRAVS